MGQKKSRKISRQISRQISLPKIKKNPPTSFCRSARRRKSQRVKTQRVKTSENFAEENKCSQKIFQKISQKMSLLLDFIVFQDIFEIFAEDCFLLRSFRKFLPSGFLPLSRFQKNIDFLEILENLAIPKIPHRVKSNGEHDHFLEILDLEIP